MNAYIRKNWLFILGILIVSIITITYITYLSRNCTYYGDDLSYTIYSQSIFSELNPFNINSAFQVHGGGYLCAFLTPLFNYYIPSILHIHPLDFMGIPNGIIIGCFFCLTLIVMTNFSNIFNKSKFAYFLIFTALSLYSLYSVLSIDSYIFGMHHSFYRYIFPLLFYGYFWQYLYKHIIYPFKKTNYLKIIFAMFSGFIIGTAIEILFVSSAITSGLILLYKLFYPSKLKLNINFYAPIITLYTSILFFIMSPGFKMVAADRGLNKTNISFTDLQEFSSIFVNICIKEDIIIWIIFLILLFFSIFISFYKRSHKQIIIPIFIEISILISMFILILCGRTFFEEGKFWISHPNIQALYKILIIYPILILYSYCSKYIKIFIKNRKILFSLKTIIVLFCTIACFIIPPELIKDSQNEWHGKWHILYRVKRTNYIVEKIYRFYSLKGQKVYLPIEIFRPPITNLRYFLWSQTCHKGTNDTCCRYSVLKNDYYPKIYKDNHYNHYEYCFSETAIEDYYKSGGSFSYEEIENPIFGNLYNPDFVLKEGKQISSQEIKINFPIF